VDRVSGCLPSRSEATLRGGPKGRRFPACRQGFLPRTLKVTQQKKRFAAANRFFVVEIQS